MYQKEVAFYANSFMTRERDANNDDNSVVAFVELFFFGCLFGVGTEHFVIRRDNSSSSFIRCQSDIRCWLCNVCAQL